MRAEQLTGQAAAVGRIAENVIGVVAGAVWLFVCMANET